MQGWQISIYPISKHFSDKKLNINVFNFQKKLSIFFVVSSQSDLRIYTSVKGNYVYRALSSLDGVSLDITLKFIF